MADGFLDFDGLRDALAAASFERPPAFVSNAHITGLGVARALAAHDVPVIALDRVGDGAAPLSDAVDYAGEVTYPLDDREGWKEDIEELAAVLKHDPVAFGCMDEWVNAYAEVEPEGVRLPFAAYDAVDAVLDKSSLYRLADDLGVPYPETVWLAETDAAEAVERLGLPLVVKPARKREGEEVLGTNVVEVETHDDLRDVVAEAERAGIEILAQEKVEATTGADRSLASYVPPSGEALGVVGNAVVRHPQGYGTSCVVRTRDEPDIAARALDVIEAAGYWGISEAEFVHDAERDEYVLLDVNTRPWKWISLPVAAGFDLPYAAYADAVGESWSHPDGVEETTWVYLPDYLQSLGAGGRDVLSRSEWVDLLGGGGERAVTGVFDPDDPEPTYMVVRQETGAESYYCSC
ncbi:carboxylate--amine ligase [Halarchaeum sp. P4]|uniref:carboxylate--amine ligase n=1 Tax=Halarchaeum sp. P4 TaxID=3421639 RepID=UPI003EB79FC7